MSGYTHTLTYTHTNTHDNYYNPRCAHAHRGLIISLMHDWCCNGSSAGVEFCWLLPYMYGAVSLESWTLTVCVTVWYNYITVFGR